MANDSFKPPSAVQAAARRGLELRREHKRGGWDAKKASQHGIGSGVVRAQTLASGKGVTQLTLRRMKSFFARHDTEKERAARQRDETSPANISWLLWGGDPGRRWAESELKRLQESTDMQDYTGDEALIEMGLPLEEAGGIVSWVKRAFTNVDHSVAEELRDDMARLRTERDRELLLNEIEYFLQLALAAKREGTLGDFLGALGLGGVSGVFGAVFGTAKGAATIGSVPVIVPKVFDQPKVGWIGKLLGQAENVRKATDAANAASRTAAEVGTQAARAGHVYKNAVAWASKGAIGASALALVLKTVYRYSGSLDDYIKALQDLRAEVMAVKIRAA